MKRERFYIDNPHRDFNAVYIAGKVTGRDYDEARAQFDARAQELEAKGWEVLNPMDFVRPGTDWQEAMRICLYMMAFADYIDLLPGWEDSKGARMENEIAMKLGIRRFRGGCSLPCSPSDYYAGGKCGKNGCYDPDASRRYDTEAVCAHEFRFIDQVHAVCERCGRIEAD